MRTLLLVAVIALAGPVRAQENLPSFEVASIKTNRSGSDRQEMRLVPGGRAVMTNVPLRRVILTAYNLLPQQLIGAPDWVESDRFDITARANGNLLPAVPGGPPGSAELALRRLLAERFQLVAHTETRELPIYELVMARADQRLGPRLSPAKIDCVALMEAYGRGTGPMPPPSDCGGSREPGRVWMRGVIIPNFARAILVGWTDRIVQDRTGLRGGYDLDLEFTPDSGIASTTPVTGADSVSLFTALEEQLGLKLRPARAPVDVLVIDRVERPTEN